MFDTVSRFFTFRNWIDNSYLDRTNQETFSESQGNSERAALSIIFLHGMCYDASAWQTMQKTLREEPAFNHMNLYAFQYDWKRAIEENGHRLSEYVERMILNQGGASHPVMLVGQSMGGLISLECAFQNTAISKVVMVGSSLNGSGAAWYASWTSRCILEKVYPPAKYPGFSQLISNSTYMKRLKERLAREPLVREKCISCHTTCQNEPEGLDPLSKQLFRWRYGKEKGDGVVSVEETECSGITGVRLSQNCHHYEQTYPEACPELPEFIKTVAEEIKDKNRGQRLNPRQSPFTPSLTAKPTNL